MRKAKKAAMLKGSRLKDCDIEAVQDRIIVQRIGRKGRTAGGIYIPEMAQDTPNQGVVISVGPGKLTNMGEIIPIAVAPGNIIIFHPKAGYEIKYGGEDYVIMTEEDVVGIDRKVRKVSKVPKVPKKAKKKK